jgi:hypothetical protein
MSFEVSGIKYCCALYGSGSMDELNGRVLSLRLPDWVREAGEFHVEDGRWNLAVGIATEDEEWRQDDDVGDFAAQTFPFLHKLSLSDGAEMSLHLVYRRGDCVAELPAETLAILAALRVRLHVEFRSEKEA